MAIDAEVIADRRRLRRKLTFWRVLGALALIAAVAVVGMVATGTPFSLAEARPQVARISVSGFITGDDRMAELLRRVADNRSVSGVVIHINSPGGTTTGSEELFRGIRQLAERKPTVAFVDGLGASGAYITALATDHIVARETALVGSIGVLFQYPDFSKLLGTVGVAVEEVKSAPLKAEPSGFHPTPPEARAALQSVVNDTYDWFKRLVTDRRKMSPQELAAVSDGRIFSGRQSVPLKLVDEVGTERDAIAWMEKERNLGRSLPVRDWKPATSSTFSLWSAAAFGADLLGYDGLARSIRDAASDALSAHAGLMALWQPPSLDR